jgi:flagellum-specific ATP synthase
MRRASLSERCSQAADSLARLPPFQLEGRVTGMSGLVVDVAGLSNHLSMHDRVLLQSRSGGTIPAEIVGFRDGHAQAMTQGVADGLGPGSLVLADPRSRQATLAVSDQWIGRVVDPLGQPLDGRGGLVPGPPRPVRAAAPSAADRARLGPRIDLGVAALNGFATCRQGQRIGLFAGSGLGKSTLLAMLARHVAADVIVLALVGERGREVREFIEDDLGPEGLARSVVVVATSDAAPLLRREAAYAAVTVAEHFRDQGKSVLLLMDSITRYCLALREIGLSAGEAPATRGFPASVFAELPRLLERAGPGAEGSGQITALFSVLVEGDDHDEPVSDAMRGLLDGHVVLDRRIAESGRFPAVDVLRSLSRTVPGCLSDAETALVRRARAILGRHAELVDLVRLGAYRAGSDREADEALALAPKLHALLRQEKTERVTLAETFERLAAIVRPGGG